MGTMYMTTRSLTTLTISYWNGAPTIVAGLLSGGSIPGALTAAAIKDVNFVTDLLGLTGVDEPSDGSYARVTLSLGTATEDDTDERIEFPANDANFGSLTATTVYGAFIFDNAGGADSARVVLGVDLLTSPGTANGAGCIYRTGGITGMADVFRHVHAV